MPRHLHLQSLTFLSKSVTTSIFNLRRHFCSAAQQWRFSVALLHWVLYLSLLISSTNNLVSSLAHLDSSLPLPHPLLLPIETLSSASSNPSQAPPPRIQIETPINQPLPPSSPPPILFSETPPMMLLDPVIGKRQKLIAKVVIHLKVKLKALMVVAYLFVSILLWDFFLIHN